MNYKLKQFNTHLFASQSKLLKPSKTSLISCFFVFRSIKWNVWNKLCFQADKATCPAWVKSQKNCPWPTLHPLHGLHPTARSPWQCAWTKSTYFAFLLAIALCLRLLAHCERIRMRLTKLESFFEFIDRLADAHARCSTRLLVEYLA